MYANTGDEIYLPDDRNMAQQSVNFIIRDCSVGILPGHTIVLWTIAVIFWWH